MSVREEPRDSEGTSELSSSPTEPQFITHNVSKLDTLAGLAIRYRTTVADIKQCNGLLSDSGLYARSKVFIPTSPIPIGQECSTWAGMILTHYGSVGALPDMNPSDSTISRLKLVHRGGQPLRLREYHSATNSIFDGSDDEDRCHLLGARPSSAQAGPVEVELMQRRWDAAETGAVETVPEHLRRRKIAESEAGPSTDAGVPGSSSTSHSPAKPSTPASRPPMVKPQPSGPGRGPVETIKDWATSQLRDKIKIRHRPPTAQLSSLRPKEGRKDA